MISTKLYKMSYDHISLKDANLPKTLSFPDLIDGCTIRIIERTTDDYFKNIEYIKCPNECYEIKDNTFKNATTLKKITLPKSIKCIGSNCFENTSIEKIKIPNECKEIRSRAFRGCSKLTTINIPNIEFLEEATFMGCEKLTNVELAEGIKYIGTQAFADCFSLKNINLPTTIESIRVGAFHNCTKLKSIIIPKSIDLLDGGCFEGCSSLTKIFLPNTIKVLKNYMFNECSSLKKITLPSSITDVGTNAFGNCKNLKEVHISSEIAFNENAFENTNSVIIVIDKELKNKNYINEVNECIPNVAIIYASRLKNIINNVMKENNYDIIKDIENLNVKTTMYIEDLLKEKSYSINDINQKLKIVEAIQIISEYNKDKDLDNKIAEAER